MLEKSTVLHPLMPHQSKTNHLGQVRVRGVVLQRTEKLFQQIWVVSGLECFGGRVQSAGQQMSLQALES